MTEISLLPGWALSASNLEPLADALAERLPGVGCGLCELPPMQLSTLEDDLQALAAALPDGPLIGWSLGGMLAVQLQRRFPQRFTRVVTLVSNACFVARTDWSTAMPVDTYKAFLQDMRDNPERTLRRFGLLVTQGAEQPRELVKQLQWDQADPLQRLQALSLLGLLDNRAAMRGAAAGSQLHCLAGLDALVPAAAAETLRQLAPQQQVLLHAQAGHALPLQQPSWLAEQIAGFLQGAP